MVKFERVIKLPALVMPRVAAEQLAREMHDLAERRVTAELEKRLRDAYWAAQATQSYTIVGGQASVFPVGAPHADEQTIIREKVESEAWRSLVRPTFGDKYTFLSPSANVQFLFDDFTYEDIPPDIDLLLAEAGGPNGEIWAIHIKARPSPLELKDPNQNRILIQGPDRAWVNDTYERLAGIVNTNKEPFRHFAYRWMPVCVWLTFLAGVTLEYKVARFATGLRWTQPLNGLQLLLAFALLALTLILSSHLFQRALPYVFPYLELEGKLARARKAWRKPVLVAVGLLYTTAVAALFAVR
jgi:hypothetical protein